MSRPDPALLSAFSVELLMSALGEGIYGIDAEGRAVFLNPAGCRMLGYSPAEFLGQRQHDAIHGRCAAGSQSAEDCRIYAVLRDGQTRRVTGDLFTRKDGSTFPVDYTATPLLEDGRVLGAVVVFQDISERRQAERELRQAHDRLQALLENLPDAAWMKDAELRYVAVNEAFVRVTGVPREAFLGRRVQELVGQKDASVYDEADRRVLRLNAQVTVEELLPRDAPRAQQRWIETIRNPIPGEAGRPVGVVAVARDVTARRLREDSERFLAEAGQVIIASLAWRETLHGLLTLVVPAMGDWSVVTLFNATGGVESVLGRAADAQADEELRELLSRRPRAFGHENELVGRTVLNGQGERLAELATADLEALLGGSGRWDPDSRLFPYSALVVPLIAESRATGVLIVVRSRERSAFTSSELLLVEEVTRRAALAIEHARVHESATERMHAREEVLRVVAHDLRGLVSSVALSAHSLQAAELAPPQQRALSVITQATQRMHRLTQDLVEAGGRETGQVALAAAPLDPRAVVQEARDITEPLAAHQGIELLAECAATLPLVLADQSRVLQVLANLLSNALQYTPRGGRVRLCADELGSEVVFSVEDTGPGIAAEDLPHVFDRFWRSAHAPRGGAGLGLAIARGIVGAHGGRIWAVSEPGQGSRFCFTLPRADTAPVRGAETGAIACPAIERTPVGSGASGRVRVLLVDDHEAIRDGVRTILGSVSWVEVVDEAAQGEEAVRKVRLRQPDVTIMDLSLPGMDGFEALRQIRAFDHRARVLVLTAHAPEKSLFKAMMAGASGFVRKASAHEDLLPALRAVLQGEVFLDPHCNHVLVRSLERTLQARRRLASLSAHEQEIIQLTARGFTAQEIGASIFLSPHTVASYRSQAMRKLGLEHRSDLVHFALETELMVPG